MQLEAGGAVGRHAEDGDGLGEDVEEGADAAGRRHPQVGRAAPACRVRACTHEKTAID